MAYCLTLPMETTILNDQLQGWLSQLDNCEYTVRLTARQALIDFDGDLTEMLIALMLEQSGHKSWEAAIILAHQRDARSIEPMKQMLTSQHPILGQVAAETLATYGSTYLLDLLGALPTCRSLAQLTIIKLVSEMDDQRAVEPLVRFLSAQPSSTAIYLTIRALTRLHDARALAVIERFADHADHHVRESVAGALQTFSIRTTVTVLKDLSQ